MNFPNREAQSRHMNQKLLTQYPPLHPRPAAPAPLPAAASHGGSATPRRVLDHTDSSKSDHRSHIYPIWLFPRTQGTNSTTANYMFSVLGVNFN